MFWPIYVYVIASLAIAGSAAVNAGLVPAAYTITTSSLFLMAGGGWQASLLWGEKGTATARSSGCGCTDAGRISHKGLNNRAENSHQPTRRRERMMKRFKSPRQVQRFLAAHDQVANIFPRRRDHDTAANLRSGRTQAFATWADVTGVAMAA